MTDHKLTERETAWGTDLSCSEGDWAVSIVGGEYRRTVKDKKFQEHLDELTPFDGEEENTQELEPCVLDLTNVGGSKFPTGQPHNFVSTYDPRYVTLSALVEICTICHKPNLSQLQAAMAEVWQGAYQDGVSDERTSAQHVDRRYGPNRNNP